MPKPCSACKHLERSAIDSAIVSDEPIADIAKRFSLDRFVITRHKKHVIELVAKSPKVEVIAQADTIVAQIIDLETLMRSVLAEAVQNKDRRTMFAAFDRVVNVLKLRSEISGELKPRQPSMTNNFISIHAGGQKGFHDQLEQLIDRARLFKPDGGGASKALPIDVGG
jgi:hypothetical protein